MLVYKYVFPMITEEESRLPLYLAGIGADGDQKRILRTEGYPEYHWLHGVRGKGKLIIQGSEYIISENMGFFFYPSVPHEYYTIEAPWETHWLTFKGHAARSLLELLTFKRHAVFNISDMPRLEMMMNDIYTSAISGNPLRGFECSHLIYKFIIELRGCVYPINVRPKHSGHERLRPVISYIERNYHNNLSMEEISLIIGVTPQHLCRIFKNAFGMRPFEYINTYRIQKAKELLISAANPSVKETAVSVGYNDPSYFCRMFRERDGVTPEKFKRMHSAL